MGKLLVGQSWKWDKTGVSRVWQSAFISEKTKSESACVTYGASSLLDFLDTPLEYGQPNKIIVARDSNTFAGELAAIDESKAIDLYAEFGLSKTKAKSDLWAELLRSSGARVYFA